MRYVLGLQIFAIFLGTSEIALGASLSGKFSGRGEGKLELSIGQDAYIKMTTVVQGRCIGSIEGKGEIVKPGISPARQEKPL
jgi:hypothetical protein